MVEVTRLEWMKVISNYSLNPTQSLHPRQAYTDRQSLLGCASTLKVLQQSKLNFKNLQLRLFENKIK